MKSHRGHLRLLRTLVLPLSTPALVTVVIYNALQVWNNFLFPLILTQSSNVSTLPLALQQFQGQFGINVPGLMAGAVAGNRLGAVRDAKGKSVYSVFQVSVDVNLDFSTR